MTGIERIQNSFHQAASAGRAALMPYYTLGFPNAETSSSVIKTIAAAGADLIELGVPFSDPLADGPVIQRSTQVALDNGMNLRRGLEIVQTLRQDGLNQPLLLMGYYNPILSYGQTRFVSDAVAAGVDGLIVPDLPYDEAGELEKRCEARGLALVYLLAPTSTPERIAAIADRSRGFIYLVSLIGVTGMRSELPPGLEEFVSRVRQAAPRTPLAVGFGINTPVQAQAVGRLADGVIVGSAMVHTVEEALAAGQSPEQSAANYVQALAAALAAGRDPSASRLSPPPSRQPAEDLLEHAGFLSDRSHTMTGMADSAEPENGSDGSGLPFLGC